MVTKTMHLPLDVLQLVLSSCLPKEPSLKARDAPLLLTHVCREWRNAALEIGSLWSNIVFPCWKELPKGVDELMALWLSRAHRARWLDVTSRFFDEDTDKELGDDELQEEVEAFQVLIEEIDELVDAAGCSRFSWRKIEREFKHIERFLLALAPHLKRIRSIKGGFPLEMVQIIGTSELINAQGMDLTFYGDRRMKSIQLLKLNASLGGGPLKRLAVNGCSVQLHAITIQRQLTHLTMLKACVWDAVDRQSSIIRLIKALPALKVFACSLVMKTGIDPIEPFNNTATGIRFALPSLETLAIYCEDNDDHEHAGIVLDEFYAPNLRVLVSHGSVYEPTYVCDYGSLYGFLVASQAPLRYLMLLGYSNEDLGLFRDCMNLCPNLEHLTMYQIAMLQPEFFQALTWTTANPNDFFQPSNFLLPKLRGFTSCQDDFECDSLVQFLTSRVAAVPPGLSRLRFAEIHSNEDISAHDLRALRECGLERLEVIVDGVRL